MAMRRAALTSGRLLLRAGAQPAGRASRAAFSDRLGASALWNGRSAAAVAPGACGRVRWFSAGNDTQVPGSRIWAFNEIKKLVEDGKNKVVFVDVREPSELLDTGKIPGAINIPITTAIQSFHVSEEDFEDMYGFQRPPKDATLLFYCKAGVRAKAAAGLAQHAGWESVGEYPGSWLDWDAQHGPVEKVGRGKGAAASAKGGQ